MELIVIGSGTCVFQTHRGAPGYVLRIGEDLILLDGGTGTLRRCLDVGVDYREIDKIFYTHLHPDHVMDLVPFLFASKYTPGFTRRDGLEIYGPAGFAEFY
ncbi:MAG: MBL fold metallo-hydrolase, partial [bacterium]